MEQSRGRVRTIVRGTIGWIVRLLGLVSAKWHKWNRNRCARIEWNRIRKQATLDRRMAMIDQPEKAKRLRKHG
jgi:hypothetical protein